METTRRTNEGSEVFVVAKSVHPSLPPRIDETLYQISPPEMVALPRVDKVAMKRENLACSADIAERAKQQEFLNWTRALFRPFVGADGLSSEDDDVISRSDSLALEYLHKCDNNVEHAISLLSVGFTAGKDVYVTKHHLNALEKSPVVACFNELKERLCKDKEKTIVGMFSKQADVESLFVARRAAAIAEAEPAALSFVPVVDSISTMETDADDADKDKSTVRSSARVQNNEKAEVKKRWQVLLSHAAKVNGGGLRSTARHHYAEALEVLNDAVAMPVPFSSAFACDDFTNVESARTVLGELTKKVAACREWIAEVRDSFARSTLNVLINDGEKRRDVLSLADLQALLSRGKSLDFYCVNEERLLSLAIDAAQSVAQTLRALWSSLSVSPILLSLSSPSSQESESERDGALFPLEDVERLLAAALGKDKELARLPLSDATLAFADAQELLCDRDGDGDENGDKEHDLEKDKERERELLFEKDRARSNRVSLEDIERVVSLCDTLSFPVNELVYLRRVLACGRALDDKCAYVLNAFAVSTVHPKLEKDKEKEKEREKRRLHWARVLLVLRAAKRFPLTLSHTLPLQKRLQKVCEWRAEVRRLQGDAAESVATTTASSGVREKRSKRDRSSGAATAAAAPSGASRSQLPLKRIDTLLAEGERMPIVFPFELSLLKAQRESAKALLKKLRESLDFSRSRKRNANEDGGEKMDLEAFKTMLEDSEVLYGEVDRPRKELERAQGVLDVAQSWLANVREIVAAHLATETRLLRAEEEHGEGEGEGEEASTAQESDEIKEDANKMDEDTHSDNIPPTTTSTAVTGKAKNVELALRRHREALAISLRDQLQTIAALPFHMDETDLVRGLLQALEWAMRNRDALVTQEKARPRLVDIQALKDEITKIRSNMRSSTSTSEADALIFTEETICLEIAKKASEFHDKLKKCLQGSKEVKAGTSIEKLHALLDEADTLRVNCDHELRPVRLAISLTEQWLADHRDALVTLGISPSAEPAAKDDNAMNVEGEESTMSDKTRRFSVNELEMLLHSASQLPTTFFALTALKQRIADARVWSEQFRALKERVTTLIRVFAITRPQDPAPPSLAQKIKTEMDKRKDLRSLTIEDVLAENDKLATSRSLSLADLDAMSAIASALPFNVAEDLQFIAEVRAVVSKWESTTLSFIENHVEPALHAIDAAFRVCLRQSPASLGIPFLESVALPSEDDRAQAVALRERVLALEEVTARVFQLERECVALSISVSPSHSVSVCTERERESAAAVAVSLCKEVLSLVRRAQQLVVCGTRWQRESEPRLRHWADVDGDALDALLAVLSQLALTLAAATQGERETERETESDPDDLLSHPHNVLSRCLAEIEKEREEERAAQEEKERAEREEREREEEIAAAATTAVVSEDAPVEKERESESGAAAATSAVVPRATRGAHGVTVVSAKRAREKEREREKHDEEKETATTTKRRRSSAAAALPHSDFSQSTAGGAAKKELSERERAIERDDERERVVDDALQSFVRTLSLSPAAVRSLSHPLLRGTQRVLSLWRAILSAFSARVRRAAQWKERLSHALSLTLGPETENLLQEATQKGFRSELRDRAESLLKTSIDWLSHAKRMLAHDATQFLKMDAFKEFIKAGDHVLLEHQDELYRLRGEWKKAKAWKTKFDAFSVAQASGGVSGNIAASGMSSGGLGNTSKSAFQQQLSCSLEELTTEAATLCVDVRDELESISQATQLYCLCRQMYFGQMVGCDLCDDWFHYGCVGLTQAMVDKQEKYVCARCAIQSAGLTALNVAAECTNKWAVLEEHFRQRDAAISKVSRKLSREYGELEKLDKQLLAIETEHRLQQQKKQRERDAAALALSQPPPAASERETAASASQPQTPHTPHTPHTQQHPAESASTQTTQPAHTTTTVTTTTAPAKKTENGTISPSSSALLSPVPSADLPGPGHALRTQADALRGSTQRLKAEHARLAAQRALELTRQADIRRWMAATQRVLWCGSAEREDAVLLAKGQSYAHCERESERESETKDKVSGSNGVSERESVRETESETATATTSTTQPAHTTAHTTRTYAQQMRVLSQRLLSPQRGLLSDAAQELCDAAMKLQITDVEDVALVLDLFRWHSFCVAALCVLRFPAPTPLLARLCEAGKTLRHNDEKILRALSGIASKASAWKSKALKFQQATAAQPNRRVEEAKLRALVLEGNNLPFTSRLKRAIQRSLDVTGSTDPSLTTTESGAEPSESGAERKRPRLSVSQQAQLVQKGLLTQAALNVLTQAVPCSTDEEDALCKEDEREDAEEKEKEKESVSQSATERVEAAQPTQNAELSLTRHAGERPYWRFSYPDDVDARVAAAPRALWPVKLSVPRRVIAAIQ